MAHGGSPQSAPFLSFLKKYALLPEEKKKNVYISKSDEPGLFNFCTFPSPVTLPPDAKRLIDVANAVSEILNESGGEPATKPKS